MKILGISCHYHDSAAALIIDGVPVAMAQEERFSRIKHDSAFPKKAIDFVMKRGNCDSVDYVVFYEKPFEKFERFAYSVVSFFPFTYGQFRRGMAVYLKDKLWVKAELKENLHVRDDQVLFVPHHLSHASSSYYCSPFQESAILTVDGVGEWTTTSIGRGEGNKIILLQEIRYPHSLGLLYSVFTAFLGFKVNDGEYKVMGLAPYGKPIYVDKILKLIDVKDDGSFRLDLSYFSFHTSTTRSFNQKFLNLFGVPRDPQLGHKFDQHHADIAASIQKVTEDILIKLANTAYELTKSKNLSFAGGVALNSVANYKLLQNTPFENIFVQPSAGDAGGSLGAAQYVYHHFLNNDRKFVMEHSYYGSEYSNEEVEKFLTDNKIPFTKYCNDKILPEIAKIIADGKVIGYFQGRSEWGPRALGNRSILADARRAEMLKTVNLKIKFRESFRPFAPSVLAEDAQDLFELPRDHYPSRFMLYVCPVKEEVRKQNLLPAITHVDGSARPQIVFERVNKRYYSLLKEFKNITGIGCFLNTSFNLSDEPIVESPEDAYKSFSKSNMDILVLNDYMVTKDGKQ